MAKRIHIDVPGVRLNETGYRMLAFIAASARAESRIACSPVAISRRCFMDGLGISQSCCVRTGAALKRYGLIESGLSIGVNGAQGANTYRLTALGIEVLRLADEAVDSGRVGVS